MSTGQTPVCVVSEMVLACLWYKYQVSNLFLKFCREMYIGITTTKGVFKGGLQTPPEIFRFSFEK